jgi:hypothetical protein
MKYFRTLRGLVNLVLIADALVLVCGLYLAFWPVKVLTVYGPDRVFNANHQVYAGDALIVGAKYCKYVSVQAAVTKTLVGNITYTLPSSVNNVPQQCSSAISREIIIPIGIVPGIYKLTLCATYRVNILRYSTVCHDSESFNVLATPPTTTTTVTTTTSSTSALETPTAVPKPSTVPYHTDPVTQEPTQRSPTPKPSLLQSFLNFVF